MGSRRRCCGSFADGGVFGLALFEERWARVRLREWCDSVHYVGLGVLRGCWGPIREMVVDCFEVVDQRVGLKLLTKAMFMRAADWNTTECSSKSDTIIVNVQPDINL